MAGEEKFDFEDGSIFIRRIPQELKDRFKAWCAARGMSMKQKIEELMRLTVSGYEIRRPRDAVQGTTEGTQYPLRDGG